MNKTIKTNHSRRLAFGLLLIASILMTRASPVAATSRSANIADATTILRPRSGQSALPYDDEFNSSTLDPKWSWYQEDSSHWNLTANPGHLRIVTQHGDVFTASSNAKNILLQPAPTGDFEIITKVSINSTQEFQQAGLIASQDVDNSVKLVVCFEHGLGGQSAQILKEIGGTYSQKNIAANLVTPVFLKLSKTGNTYTGYCSTDGVQWSQVGSHSGITLSPTSFGLLAINGPKHPSEIPADFDFFHVAWEPARIFLPLVVR